MVSWNRKTARDGANRARLCALTAGIALVAIVSPVAAAPVGGMFATRCSMCHQPDAAGLPGQYPRLAGRVGAIAAKADGRHYLALVLLNGMYGKIDVDGHSLTGLMPPAAGASDKDVADTLNALVKLQPPAKKIAPFTAAEIAAVRAEGRKTTAQVAAERTRLVAAGVIS